MSQVKEPADHEQIRQDIIEFVGPLFCINENQLHRMVDFVQHDRKTRPPQSGKLALNNKADLISTIDQYFTEAHKRGTWDYRVEITNLLWERFGQSQSGKLVPLDRAESYRFIEPKFYWNDEHNEWCLRGNLSPADISIEMVDRFGVQPAAPLPKEPCKICYRSDCFGTCLCNIYAPKKEATTKLDVSVQDIESVCMKYLVPIKHKEWFKKWKPVMLVALWNLLNQHPTDGGGG